MKIIFLNVIFLFSLNSFAKDYLVLSNDTKRDEVIDRETVKNIFLGNKLYWKSGKRIMPVHLSVEDSSFQVFLEEVIDMDSTQFTSYWRRKLFSGRAYPPKQFEKDDMIIEFIRKNNAGIGVISKAPDKNSDGLIFFQID
tara:strand:- start:2330 stop:2749 length:420 start_codon:yes stop_codon:yes gene_type:complete